MKTRATIAVGLIAVVALFLLLLSREDAGGQTPTRSEERPAPAKRQQPPGESAPVVASSAVSVEVPQEAEARSGPPMMVAPSSREELDARTARLQQCLKSSACGPGEMCGISTSGVIGCFTSNCSGPDDRSCSGGLACAPVAAGVFRCISQGLRERGALCSTTFGVNAPAEQRCAAGLECVAGRCTRGCEAGCGPDEVCERAGSRSFCIPKRDLCQTTSDCGSGRWCWREDETSGLCVQPHPDPLGTGRPSCLPGSCGEGAECVGFVDGQLFRGECSRTCVTSADCKRGEACGAAALPRGAMACTEACDPFQTDCPYGKACFERLDGGAFCRVEADVDYAAASNAATMFTEEPTRVVP